MFITCPDCGKDHLAGLVSCPFCGVKNDVDMATLRREAALRNERQAEHRAEISKMTSGFVRSHEIGRLKEMISGGVAIVLFGLGFILLSMLLAFSADSFEDLRAVQLFTAFGYLLVLGGVGWMYYSLVR